MTTDPRDEDREPAPSTRGDQPGGPMEHKPGVRKPEMTPAEERGERLDTGKTIARGGKTEGHVPGAEPADDAAEE